MNGRSRSFLNTFHTTGFVPATDFSDDLSKSKQIPQFMTNAYTELKDRLAKISDLNHAAAVLEWDQETYMPEGAAEGRALQIATLREFAHELLCADEIHKAIERLSSEFEDGTVEADLVRITKRDFDRATRIPSELVAKMARAAAMSRQAWMRARQTNDFALFSPHLAGILDLSRRQAEALGYTECAYDALLDQYEPDMLTREVSAVFTDLRKQLVPLVRQYSEAPAPDDSFLHRLYPHKAQWEFGLSVIRDFGYDFNTGRQDLSAHPFTTTFSISDVRLTTRVDEHYFNPAFFGTLHEAGHGMYEQGIATELDRTPLADGTSLGIHESQSRLWENLVGRSRVFWSHYFPAARSAFPDALDGVTEQEFYRAINRVAPSPVRVEADEVTYNLHIMVRFELERGLIDGSISVETLPEAWNGRMEEFLGIRPTTNSEGVLQDIHWSLGAIGYFPTYTLGNLMSAQLFDQAELDIDGLEAQIGRGSFGELLSWLRENVHRHGRRRSATRILRDVTGSEISIDPWIQYVKTKYEELYGY
jgi:carboxypeptidase Taq